MKLSEMYKHDFDDLEMIDLESQLLIFYHSCIKDDRFTSLKEISELSRVMVSTGKFEYTKRTNLICNRQVVINLLCFYVMDAMTHLYVLLLYLNVMFFPNTATLQSCLCHCIWSLFRLLIICVFKYIMTFMIFVDYVNYVYVVLLL